VYNFSDIRSSNPRVYAVNNNTFCNNTAKISMSRQISQNIIDLLYKFGRHFGGDDHPDIHVAVAQETLLWQPVKFGRLQIYC